EKYYFQSQLIQCKDGFKSFTRDRLNDGFCDCVDGTDEPGTPACPRSKFYCKNVGSTPQTLFSSRINDHFCDCCDGSDSKYDGSIDCPNTCFKNGNVGRKTMIIDLKIVFILEVVLVSMVAFYLFRRHIRSRRLLVTSDQRDGLGPLTYEGRGLARFYFLHFVQSCKYIYTEFLNNEYTQ
ncbi:hypothetical protein MKW92_038806, partial [Papaver armeniacum]